jgi:hypothetical protein
MATGSSIAPQRADLAGVEFARLERLYDRLDTLREDLPGELAFATLRTGLERALVHLYSQMRVAGAHQPPSPAEALLVAHLARHPDHDRSAGFPVALTETELRALWDDR